MNWQFIIMSLFGLSIFLVVVVTVLFYLQHRLVRLYRKKESGHQHPTEGRYFKRFLPLELQDIYEEKVQSFKEQKKPHFDYFDFKWHALIILVGATVIFIFMDSHWYDFAKPIDLSLSEYQVLNKNRNQVESLYQETLPSLNQYLHELQKYTLVLLSPSSQDSVAARQSELPQIALQQWSAWGQQNKIRVVSCQVDRWSHCSFGRGPRIMVVLPGKWSTEFFDQLIAAKETLVLYGPPMQVMSSGENWQWHGLKFESYEHSINSQLILRGDSKLSLGFDAGLILPVNPISRNFRVLSDDADAFAMRPEHLVTGTLETRLQAIPTKNGRAVWMDFSPNISDHPAELNKVHFQSLVASVVRYLLKKSYSSIATWPQAAPFAALVNFNMDQDYANTSVAQNMAENSNAPLTWFLISDFTQRERRLSRKLGSIGEIACAADSRVPLPLGTLSDQVQRVARCRKVLNQLTGKNPMGLHPPEEAFNDETLDAVINNNMKYFFARLEFDRLVPVIRRTKGTNKSVVQLPRISSDDYQLFSVLGLNLHEVTSRVQNEMQWLQTIGGMYSFGMSSQYMDNEEYVKMISKVILELKTSGAYFKTAQEIATWWSMRAMLVMDKKLDPDLMAKYQPKRLIVGEDGFLRKEDL